MTAEERKILAHASRSIELISIRPIELYSKVHVLKEDLPEQSIDTKLAIGRKDEELNVLGEFQFVTSSEGAKSWVEVRYKAVASYQLLEGAKTPDRAIELFVSTSSMVHLWPYFRSHVQTSCSIMQVPPFLIPPFRAGSVEFRELEKPNHED